MTTPSGMVVALYRKAVPMEGNEEVFDRVMNDASFRNIAADHLVREVYEKLRD